MERVSSQWTIIFRIFIPTIWFTTMVSLVVLLTWAVQGRAHLFENIYVWAVFGFMVLTGFVFIKLLLWRLYRVDMDDRHTYISNYFKTFKYPHSDIDYISPAGLLGGMVYRLTLKSKGSWGKNIYFLVARPLFDQFVREHPGVFDVRVEVK